MFSHLRGLERYNPGTYGIFVKLTDKLEEVGMFSRSIDLDVRKDGLTLSRRRGQWSFAWGYSYASLGERGMGTMDVFMGKPGSLIKLSSLFVLNNWSDERFELQVVSDTSSATEEFVKMRDEISEAASPGNFYSAAQRLADFFLKQPD